MSEFAMKNLTGGQLNALVKAVGGEDVVRQILSGAVKVVIETVLFLQAVKTVVLKATDSQKTSDCFINKKRYVHRDSEIGTLLPEEQKATGAGNVIAHALGKDMTFREMGQSLLETDKEDINVLSKRLIEGGYTVTLTEIEDLVERQEQGEDVGLLTNGHANFFLVVNKDGSVSVVDVFRYDRRWYVSLRSFGFADQWFREFRFFSRN